MASGCVTEVEEGQDPDEEAEKVYLIRYIADLLQGLFTGSVIEYLYLHARKTNCTLLLNLGILTVS